MRSIPWGNPSIKRYAIIAFLFPFLFRTILEIHGGPYPLGFDTMAYYIPRITGFEKLTPGEIYGWAPFHHLIASGLNRILGNPSLTMKTLSSFLHGFLGLSLFLWLSGYFKNREKALFVAMLTSFYFPVLRLTWDLQRNVLGLAFMFTTLWLIQRGSKLSLFAAGSTALSHQLVAPLLALVLLFKAGKNRLALGSLIATSAVWSSIILAASGPNVLGYLAGGALQRPEFPYPTSLNALGLFLYLSAPMLPFLSFTRQGTKRFSDPFIILSACLALAFLPSGISTRYAILACIPLSILVSAWIFEKGRSASLILATIIAISAIGYAIMPTSDPAPYFRPPAMWDEDFKYALPTSMMQNTIPKEEIPNAVGLLARAKEFTENRGKIIANRVFLSYVILEGVPEHKVVFTYTESTLSPEEFVKELNGSEAYTIWWAPGKGWHGVKSLPECFDLIEIKGRLALYELCLGRARG